jgi:hypothetical protein
MTPVALVIVATIALAVLLAAFVPGLGFIAAIAVLVIGVAVVVWLVAAGRSGQAPSELAAGAGEQEFLGPGGPDDPRPS